MPYGESPYIVERGIPVTLACILHTMHNLGNITVYREQCRTSHISAEQMYPIPVASASNTSSQSVLIKTT